MTTSVDPTVFLAFGLPGNSEWLILLVLGLLIFGRRLPEIGRSMGRSIVEFKRGIKGIGDEIESESSQPGAKKLGESKREELPSAAPAARSTEAVHSDRASGEDR